MKIARNFGIGLILSTIAIAQEQLPAQSVSDVAYEQATAPPSATPSAVPPDPNILLLPAGQPVRFVLKTPLSSERSKVGDIVDLEVIRPVIVDGLVVIPEGAQAKAVVALVRRRGRKGSPGQLAIGFREITLFNGALAQLSGDNRQQGDDKRGEVQANVGYAMFSFIGLGAPFAPLFLLQKGGGAQMPPGTQLSGLVGRDVIFERAAIQQNQPVPSPNVAVVYLFGGWHPTIGSQALPFATNCRLFVSCDDSWRGVLRLELPPGRYWLHSGAKEGVARGIFAGLATGFTFGAATPSPVSLKKVLERPIEEFFALDAKGGQTYFLHASASRPTGLQHVDFVANPKLETLFANTNGPYYIVRNISPEMLARMKEEPRPKESKK